MVRQIHLSRSDTARSSDFGPLRAALAATQETVQAYAGLFRALPDAFGQNFMISLRNHLQRLDENGIPPESDQTLRAAVQALAEVDGKNTD